MDERRACYSATLINSFILKSYFELDIEPTKIGDNLHVDFSLKLNIDDYKDSAFSLFMNIDLKGYRTDLENEDKISLFSANCDMKSLFKIKESFDISAEELEKNTSFYGLQVYPLLRDHIVSTLSKMNVKAFNAPWDVGLNDTVMNNNEDVSKAVE